ncbi:MAG: elongation factor P [Chloroflexota bacterium]|nr:MAG: elongation factor P [Chloroflexota bacterium]
MVKVTPTEFKRGMHIIHRDEPWQITEHEFVNPGKGSAFHRTKLRNLQTGRTVDFTFKSSESVEQYEVYSKDLQYLYRDGDTLTFMDPDTFNQILMKAAVAGTPEFLTEGEPYQVLLHEDEGIGLKFPKRVVATVEYTEEAARGNTVAGVMKPATLDNGVIVQVPAFVKNGDKIAVNPETREYLERA